MNAQTCSLADWDNAEDEVWNNVPAVWILSYCHFRLPIFPPAKNALPLF
jgi:hypothetical protein